MPLCPFGNYPTPTAVGDGLSPPPTARTTGLAYLSGAEELVELRLEIEPVQTL